MSAADAEVAGLLHIIRNPWGYSDQEVRQARNAAADTIDRLTATLAVRTKERDGQMRDAAEAIALLAERTAELEHTAGALEVALAGEAQARKDAYEDAAKVCADNPNAYAFELVDAIRARAAAKPEE